jgi:hypothetical protein
VIKKVLYRNVIVLGRYKKDKWKKFRGVGAMVLSSYQEENDNSTSSPTFTTHYQAILVLVPTWLEDVTNSYQNDEKCLTLLQDLALNKDSHPKFTLQSGILRYQGRIYIAMTTDLRTKIFHAFHSSSYGGHSGHKVTLHKIQQFFYWPHQKHTIATLVAECPTCQISKTEKVKYPGLISPLPIPSQKWTDISMDFIEGLPKSQGKDVILVVVDRLTKYAHFLYLIPIMCRK